MKILEPITIKAVTFRNRVVMAPMVPFSLPISPFGVMSDDVLNYYSERAQNGMGLMITQSLSVTSQKTLDGRVGIYSDQHIGYLQKLVKACHQNGTKFFAQLAYPSIGYDKNESINELTENEIEEIKNEFVKAAELCKRAGCDGVELHGAHSFFLNMMASPISNKRKDKYGGDIDGRLLLVKEIVEAISTFTDDHFIISYRMGWNNSLELDVQTAQALERIGIELLHISHGIPSDRKIEISVNFPFNESVYTGIHVKKHVNIPVIIVNGISTISRGNKLLEDGLCDFVAYGRPFLKDAAFLTKSLGECDC